MTVGQFSRWFGRFVGSFPGRGEFGRVARLEIPPFSLALWVSCRSLSSTRLTSRVELFEDCFCIYADFLVFVTPAKTFN